MAETKAEPYVVTVENAARIARWLRERGGIAIWGCEDLSRTGETWTTPVNMEDGNPMKRPHWSTTNEPIRIITDPMEVMVSEDREVKRFHIALRRSWHGLKVSDAGSRRIRREVEKAGKGAYHTFDYMTQDAVIMAPVKMMRLPEWETDVSRGDGETERRIGKEQ